MRIQQLFQRYGLTLLNQLVEIEPRPLVDLAFSEHRNRWCKELDLFVSTDDIDVSGLAVEKVSAQ